jgi:acyl-CoA thioesterase-1
MAARGTEVRVTNLGVNGYTSADLIRAELPAAAARPQPELVTCLIGVNDHVQGVAAGRYREQVQQIYAAIAAMGAAQTIAVSIPDFSFTPQGRLFGTPDTIVAGLRAFNTIAAAEATRAGMPFVDIFDVSRAGAGSPGWLAPDGLHPGRAQYSAWVDLIWETVSLA